MRYKWDKTWDMINIVFLDIGIASGMHFRKWGFLNIPKDSLVGDYMYPKDTRKENGNMDREHGATYAGGDNLLEYWEEYQKMIEETKMLDDYLDEECSPRSYNGMCCYKIHNTNYICIYVCVEYNIKIS